MNQIVKGKTHKICSKFSSAFTSKSIIFTFLLSHAPVAFATVLTNGLYSPSLNEISVSTNSTDRVRIDANGNVGIGTTTPAAKLDVLGNLKIGGSALVCDGTTINTIHSTGTAVEYCDGTTWRALQLAAPTTNAPPTGLGGNGFFVLTSGTTTGNIGGMTGAHSFCRSDLAANSWMNKPGALDSSKIFAFLCDESGCTMPVASTNYYFAVSGDATLGGASFTTDSNSRGPNDNWQWNSTNRFGPSATTFVAGYRNVNTSAKFGGTAQGTGYSCSNWSTNTGQTVYGNMTATDGQRWDDQTPHSCAVAQKLVCIVNP